MPETGTSKERLTRAAYRLFEEHGFEQTTVDEIAEAAGVGRTTFFRIFGSKEEVVFPDHGPLLGAVRRRLDSAAAPHRDLALTEAARLVLRHYLAEGDLARSRYRLTSTVPALRSREIASQRQYQRLFLTFLRSWSEAGQSPPFSPLRSELLADAIVTAHNHVLRRWLRGRTDTPEADFDEAMAEVLRLHLDPIEHDSGEGAETILVLRTRQDLDRLLPDLRRSLGLGAAEPEAP